MIASQDAVVDQKVRASLQLTMLSQIVGDGLDGTEVAYANVTFDEAYDLNIGGRQIAIRHPAAAHTPGDSFVWLPQERVVFISDWLRISSMFNHCNATSY